MIYNLNKSPYLDPGFIERVEHANKKFKWNSSNSFISESKEEMELEKSKEINSISINFSPKNLAEIQKIYNNYDRIKAKYFKDYYIFLHAQCTLLMIIPAFIKQLEILRNPSESFENYEFLRLPSNQTFTSIDDFFFKMQIQNYETFATKYSSELLTVDVCDLNAQENNSALYFFINNTNGGLGKDGQKMLGERLNEYIQEILNFYQVPQEMQPKIQQQLVAIANKIEKKNLCTDSEGNEYEGPGNLFVICVPKKEVEAGKPFLYLSVGKDGFPLQLEGNETFQGILEALQKRELNKLKRFHRQSNNETWIRYPRARIICSSISKKKGIKIFGLNNLPKEFNEEYKNELREIALKIDSIFDSVYRLKQCFSTKYHEDFIQRTLGQNEGYESTEKKNVTAKGKKEDKNLNLSKEQINEEFIKEILSDCSLVEKAEIEKLYRKYLQIKEKYSDEYVICLHSMCNDLTIVPLLITHLESILHRKEFSDFVYLRLPSNKSFKSIKEFFSDSTKIFQKEYAGRKQIDYLSSEVLSVDLCDLNKGEDNSAFYFLQKNESLCLTENEDGLSSPEERLPVLINQILNHYKYPLEKRESIITRLINMAEEYRNTHKYLHEEKLVEGFGNLFVICLPKNLVKEENNPFLYLSLEFGFPLQLETNETYSSMLEALQNRDLEKLERFHPENYSNFFSQGTPFPQGRVICSSLTPENGAKIFRLNNLSETLEQKFQNGMRQIASEILSCFDSVYRLNKLFSKYPADFIQLTLDQNKDFESPQEVTLKGKGENKNLNLSKEQINEKFIKKILRSVRRLEDKAETEKLYRKYLQIKEKYSDEYVICLHSMSNDLTIVPVLITHLQSILHRKEFSDFVYLRLPSNKSFKSTKEFFSDITKIFQNENKNGNAIDNLSSEVLSVDLCDLNKSEGESAFYFLQENESICCLENGDRTIPEKKLPELINQILDYYKCPLERRESIITRLINMAEEYRKIHKYVHEKELVEGLGNLFVICFPKNLVKDENNPFLYLSLEDGFPLQLEQNETFSSVLEALQKRDLEKLERFQQRFQPENLMDQGTSFPQGRIICSSLTQESGAKIFRLNNLSETLEQKFQNDMRQIASEILS